MTALDENSMKTFLPTQKRPSSSSSLCAGTCSMIVKWETMRKHESEWVERAALGGIGDDPCLCLACEELGMSHS